MIRKLCHIAVVVFFLLLAGPMYLLVSGQVLLDTNWRTASRASAQLPRLAPIGNRAAIVLFSAPAFHWRGMFSTHTWLAVKRTNDSSYTVYQCIGWHRYFGDPIISIKKDIPDRFWFDAAPKIEGMLIGKQAEQLLPQIERVVKQYPYANQYRMWPGPNSNTFIAYIIQHVPELHFTMPYNAVGYDYGWRFDGNTVQLGGVLGYHLTTKAWVFNILGLAFGLSFKPLGWIVPGLGYISAFMG